jgi:hypothetical protein
VSGSGWIQRLRGDLHRRPRCRPATSISRGSELR